MTKNQFKRSKFGAIKSGVYDSKLEARRALELKQMAASGLISDLKEQVVYELIPKQVEFVEIQLKRSVKQKEVCIERACCYIADFVYTENGMKIVEDTKSKATKTPEYKIKKKLMLHVHGIKIKEVYK